MAATKEIPILPFASASVWEQWLSKHHVGFDGVWLKIAKKTSGIASLTHEEALDTALCYGWIDSQRKAYDNNFFLPKFTPRRSKSPWSKRNIHKVMKLTAAGKIQPSGLAEIEAARQDGRWKAAYQDN